MSRAEVVARLAAAGRVAVGFHRQPDGDTLGSALALHRCLRLLGKKSQVLGTGPVPSTFSFLPGYGEIGSWADLDPDLDTLCLVDVADPALIQADRPWTELPGELVVIDHHGSNQAFGRWNWIEPRAAAVGEMVAGLLPDLGLSLDPEVALCLYVSLYTDTGGFRFANTRPETHLWAARFLELGVDPGLVSQFLDESHSAGSRRLLGRALRDLHVEQNGRVAWASLSADDFAAAGALPEEAEGIVGFLRSIAGVELAILFRFEPNGTRIAFRSKGQVDVAKLATGFGGGGHQRAAGASLELPLATARRRVLQEAARLWPSD